MRRAAAAQVLAVLVTLLGSSGCVRGRGTPQEPDVEALDLEGVTALDPDQIEAKLATQDPVPRAGVAGAVVKDRQRLDPDALAVDRRRVEAFYREHGYYQARVRDVEVLPAGKGLVRVVIHVEEGQPVRVTKVTVTGLESAPEARARVGEVPLHVGDVFSLGAYDGAKGAILSSLHSSGFATAEVAQSAVVLPTQLGAEVTYAVKPGPRFRFGPIFIAGTAAIPRDRIRQQVTAAVTPGDWWNEERLSRAQARVFDLGVFAGVRVSRGTPDPVRGIIPVVVAVREAPFRTLRFGPGLGFQATRWEAHGLFGWTNRNFFGELRRVSTDARVGYAWVPSPLATKKEGTVLFLAGELFQPAAISRYVDASLRLEVEKGVEEAYDFWAERLKLGLPLRIAPRWTLVPSYNLEVYQLARYGVDVPQETASATAGRSLENCRSNGVCLLTYLEQRIAWDGRDDPVNTHRGLYLSLAVQEGFQVTGFGYRYLRVLPELRAYHPLGSRTVVAFRTRAGGLVPIAETGTPPLIALFASGGPLSMRGYYTRRLAPMVLQSGQWVSLGGNGVADGTLELRHELNGNVGVALFVDAGNVASASGAPSAWRAAIDPTLLQWAAGAGLRYRTPFGPLRFDVGVRLPDRWSGPWSERFPQVPYTPHREPIAAVHLSLGEAF
jgi:translocation and assembly module TamA